MSRVRKNYILFKTEPKKEPVLAGSFSSMKRAKESIKEDAMRESRCGLCKRNHIEYTPYGALLSIEGRVRFFYKIKPVVQDNILSEEIM